MSDVRLYQTDDGGEIDVINGQIVVEDGLETAVYLSLFGGNDSDDGSDATESRQWWGNFSENDASRQYRSETQSLLKSIPAVTGNLRRIEDAMTRDLAWMRDSLATAIAVEAVLVSVDRVAIAVHIEIDDREYDYAFTEAWRTRLAQ